eukprot:CAMPEP_0197449138 /NCGR_PEP_ID=MMETSP1175-20131217/20166_1 /TAXON_ID=1003142 /ORGANISM="Triceratium dubium, Strain CCMP147" /LENGTH=390 /DNA_ID=CAMNT_0042981163 /DNA_START=66 /DNA_END=1235 /DNA_ORIENTATION=+
MTNKKDAKKEAARKKRREEAAAKKREATKKQAEKVLADNPNAMDEFMVKVRTDPNFCGTLYKDCPGMQAVFEKNPDLRKIYEDPVKMRAGYEAVYRRNRGMIDDDDDGDYDGREDFVHDAMMEDDCYNAAGKKKKSEKKPVSKAQMKRLQQAAKIKGYVGMAMSLMSPVKLVQKGFKIFLPSATEDALGEGDGDGDGDDDDDEYMMDPEVAEEIDRILESGQNLEDAIEENDALRKMRDENPLIAQMMHDPETFQTIMEPDNLKACGELNAAMEQDFMKTLENLEGGGEAPDVPDAPEAPDAETAAPEPRSVEPAQHAPEQRGPTGDMPRGEGGHFDLGHPEQPELVHDSIDFDEQGGADAPQQVEAAATEPSGESRLDVRGPDSELHHD